MKPAFCAERLCRVGLNRGLRRFNGFGPRRHKGRRTQDARRKTQDKRPELGQRAERAKIRNTEHEIRNKFKMRMFE
jgi:hypothetical protein